MFAVKYCLNLGKMSTVISVYCEGSICGQFNVQYLYLAWEICVTLELEVENPLLKENFLPISSYLK